MLDSVGSNFLIVKALNTGREGGNTATVSLKNGSKKIKQLELSPDINKTTEAIEIKYISNRKPKQ